MVLKKNSDSKLIVKRVFSQKVLKKTNLNFLITMSIKNTSSELMLPSLTTASIIRKRYNLSMPLGYMDYLEKMFKLNKDRNKQLIKEAVGVKKAGEKVDRSSIIYKRNS